MGFYDEGWGGKPITDYSGSKDHRGRKYPICGCFCVACYTAWVNLFGGEKDDYKTRPAADRR